jgi:hypothetical protein
MDRIKVGIDSNDNLLWKLYWNFLFYNEALDFHFLLSDHWLLNDLVSYIWRRPSLPKRDSTCQPSLAKRNCLYMYTVRMAPLNPKHIVMFELSTC